MHSRLTRLTVIALAVSLAALPCASFSQASRDIKKRDKTAGGKNVWNYNGGIYFQSDGGLPEGPCFRISGRVIAPDFFQDLKRVDFDQAETVFRRGNETVTHFPQQVRLEFTIHDFPCSLKMDQPLARRFLERTDIESLRVALYWKHGLELRPVERLARPQLFVHPRPAPTYPLPEEISEKFEWFYVYDLASAGIPVTDSLVVVMRTPGDHMAVRVAARM